MKTIDLPESKLTKKQTKTNIKKYIEDGEEYKLRVNLRFDDECGNNHNTFAITGDLYRNGKFESCGCIHEEIVKHFPEYEGLIKWHGCTSEGPLHYISNTLYQAGDKDCWGKRKGEVRASDTRFKFEVTRPTIEGFHDPENKPTQTHLFPIPYKPKSSAFVKSLQVWLEMVALGNSRHTVFDFEVLPVPYEDTRKDGYNFEPHYTWGGFEGGDTWYKAPFDTEAEALAIMEAFRWFPATEIQVPTLFGDGKDPDLQGARRSAIWPEANLAQLQNKEALNNRLPALLGDFKQAMEGLGFIY